MILGTISICLTVLVLNVHHRQQNQKVPQWLKRLVLEYLARLVCVRTRARRANRARDKIYVKKHEKIKKNPEGNGVLDELELLSLTVNSRPSNGPRMLPPLAGDTTTSSANNHSLHEITESADDEDDGTPENCKDWHEIAHVMDRLFFWILLVSMTVSGLLILLYPMYTGVLEY